MTDSPVTPIEECVLHLAAHHSRPLTRSALSDALPDDHDSDPLQQLRAAITAAKKAGLRAVFGERRIDDIHDALLPAALILKDGGAVVLHKRTGDKLLIFVPGHGHDLVEIDLDTLTPRLTGHVLTLQVEHEHTADERETGQRSHWFRDALLANRWSYIQVAIAAVLVNILALVVSLFTMVVYDRILPSGATSSLLALTIGVGIALLADFVVKTLRAGFIDHAGRRADLEIGQRLFDHVSDMEMRARKGSIGHVAATIREFETLRDFFTSATMVALVDLPFVIIFLGVIYALAGPLVLVPALALPVVLLIGAVVQPLLGRLESQVLAEGQAKQSVLVETLSGIETIKATGAGRRMRARWADASRRQSAYAVRSRQVTQGAINATGFVQQGAQVLVVVHGALLAVNNEVTAGVLIAAVILTGRVLAPLALITQTLARLDQARSAYRSLDALMQLPGEHPVGKTWMSRPGIDGGLRFENVSFTYPDQSGPALENISFDIKAGERVAILGTIGSGKSTVTRLAVGLYPPDEGIVLADGVDIRQIDPLDLRRDIGIVPQDPWLVSGTLRENIALGAIRPSDEDILRAARMAGVEEFAARHPDGYDMLLGEGGKGLSGGQKQLVALARALVDDPPLLLLDEPTAGVDTQNEAALIKRLEKALEGRTLLLMTHRSSLLRLVSRVIVLDNGKLVADGDKSELADGRVSVVPRKPAGAGNSGGKPAP